MKNILNVASAILGLLAVVVQPEFLSQLPVWGAALAVFVYAGLNAAVDYLQQRGEGVRAFFTPGRRKTTLLSR